MCRRGWRGSRRALPDFLWPLGKCAMPGGKRSPRGAAQLSEAQLIGEGNTDVAVANWQACLYRGARRAEAVARLLDLYARSIPRMQLSADLDKDVAVYWYGVLSELEKAGDQEGAARWREHDLAMRERAPYIEGQRSMESVLVFLLRQPLRELQSFVSGVEACHTGAKPCGLPRMRIRMRLRRKQLPERDGSKHEGGGGSAELATRFADVILKQGGAERAHLVHRALGTFKKSPRLPAICAAAAAFFSVRTDVLPLRRSERDTAFDIFSVVFFLLGRPTDALERFVEVHRELAELESRIEVMRARGSSKASIGELQALAAKLRAEKSAPAPQRASQAAGVVNK